ncbi:PEP-utilizing enzyme [Sciscionella marina]|uniref:PEP-utilizing enzyme n=1 Tax=Sciscionella marina TaxID=508770 RepID=UPI0003A089FC|nr:PEP-utilizing enzyme [Sciscionella marina]
MMTESQGDVLHSAADPSSYYSTTNLGEAMPGVLTPLGWSVWGPASELAARSAFVEMGALPRAAAAIPERDQERVINIFYGRVAARVDFLCAMGDRLPGSSGEAIATQFLGMVPPGFVAAPTRRRYPIAAVKLPRAFVTVRKRMLRESAEVAPWWAREVERTPRLGLAEARAQFTSARRRFDRAVELQSHGMFIGVQPVYDQLLALIEKAGMGESGSALMGGQGSHAETEIVDDLWGLAHGEIGLEEFLRRHGYHGPLEGDIAGRVWREDPSPVLRLAEQYRGRTDEHDPLAAAARRSDEREEAEAELLAALPRGRRAGAKAVLSLARKNVPLRGVGKVTFLRSLDVARAAARRIGVLLADRDLLGDPEDILYLTADEVAVELPPNARDLISTRQEQRMRYLSMELPVVWQGTPEPISAGPSSDSTSGGTVMISGMGVSRGVVEGVVRVVNDPDFAEVEPDEIIVAATTDPSWASVLFLSKALVVDIGGQLSHAAVVARELGIPCVVNTKEGTRVLRTGDYVRVDGDSGDVEVLEREHASQTG